MELHIFVERNIIIVRCSLLICHFDRAYFIEYLTKQVQYFQKKTQYRNKCRSKINAFLYNSHLYQFYDLLHLLKNKTNKL